VTGIAALGTEDDPEVSGVGEDNEGGPVENVRSSRLLDTVRMGCGIGLASAPSDAGDNCEGVEKPGGTPPPETMQIGCGAGPASDRQP
jgi:hypothetical protein